MPQPFKRIGLFGRAGTPGVTETLQSLINYLKDINVSVCIESETAAFIDPVNLPAVDRSQLGAEVDLLIVVGGDGSLLYAAHSAVDQKIPVLGINRGRLGFLTDILPTSLKTVGTILQGQYKIEDRFLLTATIARAGHPAEKDDALNEVAIMPAAFPHMVEFEIYIDDEFVCSQHADGMVAATPTGSTAYALSGGGPILHPSLDAIVLVPMFSHSLSSRPIVVPGNVTVKVNISPENQTTPRLSCDGRPTLPLPPGCEITLHKKTQALKLIHPMDYCYYEALRSKLHWGKKLTYRE